MPLKTTLSPKGCRHCEKDTTCGHFMLPCSAYCGFRW